jgi:hypothetical protein
MISRFSSTTCGSFLMKSESICSGRRFLGRRENDIIVWIIVLSQVFRFKVTEIALMMDWEDATGGSGSEDESDDMWNLHKAVSNLRDSGSNPTHVAMRGLQVAVTEGWLITRARDMCSFAHDRYRQAAQAEAEKLPPETIAKMSFRVRADFLLHYVPKSFFRLF